MENNTDKQSIVKNIYGEDYGKDSPQDDERQRRKEYRQERVVKSRIVLVFSITVTLLSLFCLFTLNPNSPEYIVCLFVIILNVILISSICILTFLSKRT